LVATAKTVTAPTSTAKGEGQREAECMWLENKMLIGAIRKNWGQGGD